MKEGFLHLPVDTNRPPRNRFSYPYDYEIEYLKMKDQAAIEINKGWKVQNQKKEQKA